MAIIRKKFNKNSIWKNNCKRGSDSYTFTTSIANKCNFHNSRRIIVTIYISKENLHFVVLNSSLTPLKQDQEDRETEDRKKRRRGGKRNRGECKARVEVKNRRSLLRLPFSLPPGRKLVNARPNVSNLSSRTFLLGGADRWRAAIKSWRKADYERRQQARIEIRAAKRSFPVSTSLPSP